MLWNENASLSYPASRASVQGWAGVHLPVSSGLVPVTSLGVGSTRLALVEYCSRKAPMAADEGFPSKSKRKLGIGLSLLAVILLVFPVELLVVRVASAEPYPALFMPSFAGVPSDGETTTYRTIMFTAETPDGDREITDLVDHLPDGGIEARSIVVEVFADPELYEDPEAQAWITEFMAEHYPQLEATALRVTWLQHAHVEDTGEVSSEIDREFVITLGGTR